MLDVDCACGGSVAAAAGRSVEVGAEKSTIVIGTRRRLGGFEDGNTLRGDCCKCRVLMD